MDKKYWNNVFIKATNKFRELSPIDTGHMVLNATKGHWISDNHYQIVIDKNVLIKEPNINGKIAGYYYAGRLENDPKYKTYGFVEKNARAMAQYIAEITGGQVR